VLVPSIHTVYIAWDEYEGNQRRIEEGALALGDDRRRSPPHEGPALVQGMVLCGVCGCQMSIRYHDRAIVACRITYALPFSQAVIDIGSHPNQPQFHSNGDAAQSVVP
jgi:hypothetical protein